MPLNSNQNKARVLYKLEKVDLRAKKITRHRDITS